LAVKADSISTWFTGAFERLDDVHLDVPLYWQC
jgi:hypothetical protein